ncbi:hypothetical protein KC340_g4065 [Hortaea werneckii]|nr:hypothetical protein KC340_g4065 [Hortaea werneckii]KAI7407298.1 hypothetical protein KC328_g614 [Hortaea werneckii]
MAAASAPTSATAPTEHDCLAGFEEALQKESRKATFTCAGRLPINLNPNLTPSGDLTPRTDLKVHEQTLSTKPIRIRWGANGAGKTLSLPLQDPSDEGLLQDLIAACHPATSGRGGQDILDPTYRRAGALRPADFMTDFCPYESGILDITKGGTSGLTAEEDRNDRRALGNQRQIAWKYAPRGGGLHTAQLRPLLAELDVPLADEDEVERVEDLLDPERSGYVFEEDVFAVAAERLGAERRAAAAATSLATVPDLLFRDTSRRMRCRGLRAELYKLNVYSGPGEVFRPHVDTPRNATQIGSLVVCLPVAFSGGELVVRHQRQEIIHDWGRINNNNANIIAPAAAAAAAEPPAINWTAFHSDCAHEVLPLHTGHRLTLTYNLFLSHGTGLLNLPHLLPHRLTPHHLPLAPHLHRALANPDFKPDGGYLAFWLRHRYPLTHPVGCEFVVEMLKGADLSILAAVRGVGLRCSVERVEHFPGGRDVLDEGVWRRLAGRWGRDGGAGRLHPQQQQQNEYRSMEYEEAEQGEEEESIPSSLRPLELKTDPLNPRGNSEPDEEDFHQVEHSVCPRDGIADEDGFRPNEDPIVKNVLTRERRQRKEGLTWIGRREGRREELSGAYLVYGNEAELSTRYSSAALVVRIPSWAERRGGTAAAGVSRGTREDPMVL